jgi:CO dehydrogenase maturation factor
MRIAFCGKGGSGKSTVSSLFSRYLAMKQEPVLVIDGDINQHLGEALGFDKEAVSNLPCLGMDQAALNKYVRGTNPHILADDHVLETTPAGNGSGLIWFDEQNDVFDKYQIEKDGIRFMSVGGHSDDDVGATCYHKFTGAFGVFLNHLMDGAGQYVIGDMCAGADPFASCSLATRFDAIFLVVEPTLKSTGVYDQCRKYGDPFGVKIFVIGNKVEDEADEAFIRERVGDSLIGCIGNSKFVRNIEKGVQQDISALEENHLALLENVKTITDGLTRDWAHYREVGVHFHKQASQSWGDELMNTDLMAQIDHEFKQEDLMQEQKVAA